MKRILQVFSVMILLASLVGCQAGDTVTASLPTATRLIPSETIAGEIEPSPTIISTATAEPTQASTPTPPPTPTVTPTLPPPQGTILELINQVEAHPLPGREWEQALTSMSLYSGGEVWAKEASTALLDILDDRVRVAPNTIFTLMQPDEGAMQLDLEAGQIWINIEGLESGESFEVTTPTVAASVRGTRFSVRVEPDGWTIVSSQVNTVTVTTAAGMVDVGASTQTTVLPGEAPSPPEPISFEEQLRWEMAVGDELAIGLPVIDVTDVIHVPAMTGETSWSHDGQNLAFFYYNPKESFNSYPVIYDIGWQDFVPKVLPDEAHQPVFNPAQQGLAYLMDTSQGTDLCTDKLDGSNPICFGAVGKDYSDPVWSPDGERILYGLADHSISSAENLFVALPDGSQPTQLTAALDGYNFRAAWSPDASQVAYVYSQDQSSFGIGEVWVVNVDGSDPRQVFLDVPWGGNLAWSPDGQWLALASRLGLNLVRPDGSEVRPVAGTESWKISNITWSPSVDGWPLVFGYQDEEDNQNTVYLTREDSPPHELRKTTWGPVWSPDGRRGAWAIMQSAPDFNSFDTQIYLFQLEPEFWP